ncbi:TRAP transporter substrate-binding protein [Ideonella livida]|uniref:TRAP transporter substrate-binding protein n=1 Tax=Ideonella livida TaxID=2707176 RepID=A0A7C9TIP2_9BURK|nr:TRAP transporter substrate-binding protein [Ideonella livida]NDY90403.1 TRAP transporter substrate-binding protein [Ideonella livida]
MRAPHKTLKTLAAAALAAVLAPLAGTAQAQEVTLKVHFFLPATSYANTLFITPWCEKIAKESANRLKCQIFPSMQMGGTPPQLFDQVKDGVADVIWTLPGYTAGRFPSLEVFELPFMMQSPEATSKALWDYTQKYSLDEFKDVKPLAFHVHGDGVFHMTSKPIKTLADLKGLKLRAPTRMTNKYLALLGATPVGMPVPQVGDALSKGVIDGAVVPYEVVPSVKIQELVKYHVETDPAEPAFYTSTFVFAMNKAKYESLPADLKKVIDANSGQALSGQIGKAFLQADMEGKKLTAKNTTTVIPAAELAHWKKAGQSLTDAWVSDMNGKGKPGAQMLEAARSLIAQHAAKR